MQKTETLRELDRKYKKRNPMTGLLASGMVALPLVGLITGAMGMASSAEQARDTLDELIKDVNVYSETHEGLMPSAEALNGIVSVDGEGTVGLNAGYHEDQLEVGDLTSNSGATLAEDLHSVEAYVKDVYGDNVPAEFLELFNQAESEIAYNQNSMNVALGSAAVGVLVGAPGALALVRAKSKNPSDPTSIDV